MGIRVDKIHIYNNINTYRSMSKTFLTSSCMNMYYRDSRIGSEITDETFKKQIDVE